MQSAVIVDAVRTASGKGKPGGALAGVHPVDLLATVLAQLVERNGIDPAQIDDVIGGCVTQSGEQALNITRNAVFAGRLPRVGSGHDGRPTMRFEPTGRGVRGPRSHGLQL